MNGVELIAVPQVVDDEIEAKQAAEGTNLFVDTDELEYFTERPVDPNLIPAVQILGADYAPIETPEDTVKAMVADKVVPVVAKLTKQRLPEVAPVVEAVARPSKRVIFTGAFGTITAGYVDIYNKDLYIILVEDIDNEYSFTPPYSDDVITITYDNKDVEVVSPGITIPLVNQGVKMTLLLQIGKNK